jgi:hypothetical protein
MGNRVSAAQGRCATCRHWGHAAEGNEERATGRWRSCDAPAFHYGYGVNKKHLPANGALIEHDEGWGMFTGLGFGCIHWTAQTDEER